MREVIHQGEILKIEKIKVPVLVVSKDFFNRTGEVFACPIYREGTPGPLHIWIHGKEVDGYAQCEKMALLDMQVRGYAKVDRVPPGEMMDIVDAIQGIFDYI